MSTPVEQPSAAISLRHVVATIGYRAAKTLRGAPPEFANYGGAGRTPAEILAHMGDLFDWSAKLVCGTREWHDSTPLAWDAEVARFFAALKKFDDCLAGGPPVACPIERLFQGPLADALTHVGQLAMLRRMSGAKITGENYFVANMEVGRIGLDQPAPVREF